MNKILKSTVSREPRNSEDAINHNRFSRLLTLTISFGLRYDQIDERRRLCLMVVSYSVSIFMLAFSISADKPLTKSVSGCLRNFSSVPLSLQIVSQLYRLRSNAEHYGKIYLCFFSLPLSTSSDVFSSILSSVLFSFYSQFPKQKFRPIVKLSSARRRLKLPRFYVREFLAEILNMKKAKKAIISLADSFEEILIVDRKVNRGKSRINYHSID